MREKYKDEPVEKLTEDVIRECFVSWKNYFAGAGNGEQAKMSVAILGRIVGMRAAENNKRGLELVAMRIETKIPLQLNS